MLSRAILSPASINFPIISGDSVAGPNVATIFVFRTPARIVRTDAKEKGIELNST
jgi:hypothetical protein